MTRLPAGSSGEYVSTYDFQRAVDDQATVPLYYDARGEKLGVAIGDLNERIAAKLEELETYGLRSTTFCTAIPPACPRISIRKTMSRPSRMRCFITFIAFTQSSLRRFMPIRPGDRKTNCATFLDLEMHPN